MRPPESLNSKMLGISGQSKKRGVTCQQSLLGPVYLFQYFHIFFSIIVVIFWLANLILCCLTPLLTIVNHCPESSTHPHTPLSKVRVPSRPQLEFRADWQILDFTPVLAKWWSCFGNMLQNKLPRNISDQLTSPYWF